MSTPRLVIGSSLGISTFIAAGLFYLPSASADVDQCGDLLICIDTTVPGSTGGGGGGGSTGGSTGGGGGGGGEVPAFPDDPGNPGPIVGDPVVVPPVAPPLPLPREVADMALAQLQLRKPVVHMNPSEGHLGLVGLPVWLWIDSNDPTRWSPGGISKTLTVRGVTVTVVARSTLVTWDMGDGKTEECTVPGRPYQGDDENIDSDCTHRYESTSQGQPGSKFPVSATVTWKASYTGPTGTFDMDDLSGSAGTTVRVGELQVMNESAAP